MSTKSPRGGKQERRTTRAKYQALPSEDLMPGPRIQASRQPLRALNDAQHCYINAINVYDIIFSTGPFGTGKTYVAAAMAADAFARKEIETILITRPAVGAEEEYGFFPGTLEEKVAPWAAPVIKILEERLGSGAVEYALKSKQIEVAPLGMLRGHTFNDCWAIFDEAQNCTPSQMKLFLSRHGRNCKMIIDGDLDQKDIVGRSGLEDGLDRMSGHPQVGSVMFDIDDIVRSGLARDICIRYSQKRNATVGHEQLGLILGDRPA